MLGRVTAILAWGAVALALLTGCGGEGGGGENLPSFSPTVSPTRTLPAPTRTADTPEPEPTETATEPEPTATDSPEPEPEPEPEPTTREPQPSESASPSAAPGDEAAEESDATEDETPSWVWWLVAALVLLAILIIVLILRARGRRGSWEEQFTAAVGEVSWFARELLPQLRRAGSVERLAGGWQVGAARVAAVEDRLTALEATATNEDETERARNLRDTVRLARGRIEALTGPGPHPEWALDVDDVIAALEAAIAPPQPREP